jgi:chromate reductase, NAD(P)H dehydrogenase (quinone)
MERKGQIRIVSILGSMRAENMTGKAFALANDELRQMDGVEVSLVDPAGLRLAPPGGSADKDELKALRKKVSEATGIILSTPEYHGSYSSTVKLVIDNLGFPSALGGKPIALLGVAAGTIGAIKALEHLRSVCSHVGGIVLPGPVSVAGVNKLFDPDGNCLDEKTEKRIRGVAHNLVDYIRQSICPRIALEEMVRK